MEYKTSDLDGYVAKVCESKGDFSLFRAFKLKYDTIVDQELDPFSEKYYEQQLALYREIAGREIEQASGELHKIDISKLIDAPNPMGIVNVADIGEHVRCNSTMLSLCCLFGQAEILDMGAGYGISSEVYAFSAAKVHAVDIDPLLSRLAIERASRRSLDIIRHLMNFDDVEKLDNDRFEAPLFFQSLHHCLKPWELINVLSQKLTKNGVICFSGEPIQSIWWKNWGLRLDQTSVFVARAHGWFESGWALEFITECFARNGMDLTIISGGSGGGIIGIATKTEDKKKEILNKAGLIGLTVKDCTKIVEDSTFSSVIGSAVNRYGRPGYAQVEDNGGVLLYGPYVKLPAGRYESRLSRCPRYV